jgi:hypothetical protein
MNNATVNAESLPSLKMDHLKCKDIKESGPNKGFDNGNKIQKSIRSFFTKATLDSSGATAVQNNCLAGHEASEAVSEILAENNLTPLMLKVDVKSMEKGSEAHLDTSMDMDKAIKSFMEGEMDTDPGEKTAHNQEGKYPDSLKNQEKENKMESSLNEVVSSCTRKSSEKTPVLPTRKNPNRRISVTDLIVPSNENSDF